MKFGHLIENKCHVKAKVYFKKAKYYTDISGSLIILHEQKCVYVENGKK